MKILFIHADSMEYSARTKTKNAEEVDKEHRNGAMRDALVCFITVEREDEGKASIADAAMENIREVAKAVGASNVLLYPYAHLSSHLASPEGAISVLKEIERKCSAEFNTMRAPFGWYKSFTLSCKGHPLSELSRSIEASAAGKKEEGRYFIFTKDAQIIRPEEYSGGSECFMAMVGKEALKKQTAAGNPEYLKLCRKFGIEWERMSDTGHEVYNPEAALMFDLASDYATSVVNSMGLSVFSVKGTNMFNLSEKAVNEHAVLFGDRLYTIESEGKEFVLRYAACHQQFSMMSRWNISYRQMPVAAFEIADAYRYEQSGETMLLFRLRRLNMPDLHVLCRDIDEAYVWFERIHNRIYEEIGKLGTDYEMLVNVSSERAFDENREFILRLIKGRGKDSLIHIYPPGANFYWTVNIEYHMLDDMGRAREIGTVQIDVGNASRFDISYTDASGKKQRPIILHTAVLGTIERFMYAMFDAAIQRARKTGRPGYLPFWFTPEQIRLLPISSKHLERAREIARAAEAKGFRAGIDDREMTIAKKVREAKQDWVSLVVVIGDREIAGDKLQVYDRERDEQISMSVDELLTLMSRRASGYPARRMYFPADLSKRVAFQ